MIRIVLLILFIATTVGGQTLDTLEIKQFSLGLHTSVKPIFVPSGAGTVVHEIDLSEGVLQVRKGYDSVAFIPGMDGLVGLYGAYYSWGEQQLIGATDSTGVGYGGIYASQMGTHDFGEITDTFRFIADTLSIRAEGDTCADVKPRPPCLDDITDSIVFGDTTWTLTVDKADPNIYDIDWWTDTITTWINDSMGSYLTATQSGNGDTTIIAEDATNLDFILYFSHATILQAQGVTTGAARVWPYWSTQNPTSFAMFDDNVYMVNGDQRGVVWNGEIAHAYPLAAFGEPLITPLALQSGDSAAYTMDGEVRYALRHRLDSNEVTQYTWGSFGPVSAPVKTKNGRFLLRNFALMSIDSVQLVPDSTKALGVGDTLTYLIYRTFTNPGPVDETMKLYKTELQVECWLDSALVRDVTSGDTTKFESLGDVVVIDSLPDSALTNRDAIGILVINNVFAGRDSTGAMNRRSGAPTFVSMTFADWTYGGVDSILDSLALHDSTETWGLFWGIPPQKDTLAFAYAVAPMDTLTGNEGPLSEWCVVFSDDSAEARMTSVRLGLPPLPPKDSGIVYNLYRALVYQVGLYTPARDTLLVWESNIEGTRRYSREWLQATYAVDTTIIWFPYLVAQIPAADTIYTDSMRYDSLELRRAYEQVEPPARMSRLFAYDNFMFGHDGSLLYRSQVDSATKWGFWDYTPVNNNDGDRITVAYPKRRAIAAKKNFTSWNVFSEYTKTEINQGFGCIAPFSYTKGAAHYFLSNRGIEKETDGQFLERTVNTFPLSAPLASFRNRTIADLSNMVAMYVPTEQLALFSLGDTTWAYFEEAGARTQEQGGWATWSMTFKGATLFDTEDELNFIPGKTMYFYQDDDPNIYRYGTATTDNGSLIAMEWRSGAFGVDRHDDRVIDLGLWVNSTDNADSILTAFVYNQDGTKNDSTIFPSLSNSTYLLQTFGGFTATQWFQIGLSNSGTISNTDINMIDFSVNPQSGSTEPGQ